MSQTTPLQVVKRDGRIVPFDRSRIERAVSRVFDEVYGTEERSHAPLLDVLGVVIEDIVALDAEAVGVERIQDLVEQALMAQGRYEAAKAYILYREEHRKLRDERPIPEEVRAAFAADERYFPTALQKFQFYDKYSRFNYTLGRRETWVETVDRTVHALYGLAGDRIPSETYAQIRRGILEMKVMPSMRLLAMAGPAFDRSHITGYNCSFMGADSIDAFVEALIISMAGCGVGYSVESKYVDKLPAVAAIHLRGGPIHVIEDSTEGWAHALRYGLECWFSGADVVFDYSQIRPAGTPLLTKGGRASGPEPLKKLLDFCRAKVLSRAGKRLRPLDAHDMLCAIGQGVVSGGVRRTALISLFDEDDEAMLHCKDGDFERENSQRWNANNSAVTAMDDPLRFLERFTSMLKAGRGEPGIFNPRAALDSMPSRRRETIGDLIGTNPCFGKDTLVQTRAGHFPIQDLIGRTVEIWNGENWQEIDNFRATAQNQPMLKITLHDGSVMRATPYHTFILEDGSRVQAKDLVPDTKLQISTAPLTHGSIRTNGAYLKGLLLAEGTILQDRPILYVYGPKQVCEDRLLASGSQVAAGRLRTTAIEALGFRDDPANERHTMTGLSCRKDELGPWASTYKQGLPSEVFAWDLASKSELLAGLFDGDGTASDTRNGFLYQLTSIQHDFLQDVQQLLKTVGVYSHLSLMKEEGTVDFGDGYGEYFSKRCWRLTLSQRASVALSQLCRFERLVSFDDRRLAYNVKPKFNRVVSVEPDGEDEEVYCCTVEGSHSFSLTNGIHSAQCGEIVLQSQQFCNLSAAVLRADDTFESLREKVELATVIGTIQSLATDFPGLRPEWARNCEQERLLGVDITGQQDNPGLLTPRNLSYLRGEAVFTNLQTARRLGVNPSASVTCVKPSGNTSQLVDCASGLHARWAPYYIRNVRVAATSPLARVLKDVGAPMAPENGDDPESPRTWVVSFPVKAPDGAVTRNDRSAVEQCEWWLRNKRFWTEHNPSVTITYRPDEVVALTAWVWEHRDRIGGMAFLPAFDAKYDQLPYIEIDREEYERRVAEFPEIDFSKVYRYEASDMTTAAQELACSAGVCELP